MAPTEPAIDFTPGCPLSEVVATPLLYQRPAKRIDPAAEADAFSSLSNAILAGSDSILDLLVRNAMQLSHAHSAGLSLEDLSVTPTVFRWRAVCGKLAPFLNGTMPRDFSPCGETVARNQPMLMREPVRHYRYASTLNVPLREALLAPFAIAGKPSGTVWIVAHDDSVQFTAEDARCVQLLSTFAGMALTAIQKSKLGWRGHGETLD
jgi:hypothetical protein